MSVQAMSYVIDNSAQKGATFLCLLMIANHAHADGTNSFPGIPTLAKECRMSRRQIQRLVRILIHSGEIEFHQGGGRNHPNRYAIRMDGINSVKMSPFEKVTNRARKGDKSRIKGDIAVSPEPINHQQPSSSRNKKFTTGGKRMPVDQSKLPSSIRGGEKKKGSRKRGPGKDAHIGVQKFFEVRGVMPKKETYPLIAQALGEHPTTQDLTFWMDVIRNYIACGWNPLNVAGMLDWYRRRELPHVGRGDGPKIPARPESSPESGLATLEDIQKNNPELYARILAKQGGGNG